MNCSSILTFIIFRSHLMEVERNQFSLLLKEAYSCLSLWFKYVHMVGVWVGGFSLSLLSLTLGIFLSLFLSVHNVWLSSFSFCVHFSFALLSLRLSQCISEALNEDSQHFPLPANTLSKKESRSRKSIFFHIIKSSSTALACMISLV